MSPARGALMSPARGALMSPARGEVSSAMAAASATGGGAETAFRYVGDASLAAAAGGAVMAGVVVAGGRPAVAGNGGMKPPLFDAAWAALAWGTADGVAPGDAGMSTCGANAGAEARSALMGSAGATCAPLGPLLTTDQAPYRIVPNSTSTTSGLSESLDSVSRSRREWPFDRLAMAVDSRWTPGPLPYPNDSNCRERGGDGKDRPGSVPDRFAPEKDPFERPGAMPASPPVGGSAYSLA